MDLLSVLLLCLTVVLSAGRNILSKSISGAVFGTRDFFLAQAMIFGCGSIALLLFGGMSDAAVTADATVVAGAAVTVDATVAAVTAVAPLTLMYALIYGVLLVSAQWCYTVALKDGNTAICSTVYSLGFIFPTMSGAIFWQESLTVVNMVGILCVVPAIVISGMKAPKDRSGAQGEKTPQSEEAFCGENMPQSESVSFGENMPQSEKASCAENMFRTGMEKNQYIFPLIIAMLSSGGLGIMQKVQQSSPYPDQKSIFVLVAFIFACAVSAVCGVVVKPGDAQQSSVYQDIGKPGHNAQGRCQLPKKRLLYSGGVGICFGCCNLLNTTLAGRLDSAVFFPVNNISVILLSMVLSVIIFKEKIRKKEVTVLLLGILSILLLTS